MKTVHSFNELYQHQSTVSNLVVFNKAIHDSSDLSDVRVDKHTGDLIVEFTDGAIYGYQVGDKAQELMDAIFGASSKGGYFYRHIRMSYPYYKIREKSPYRKRKGITEKLADWIWRTFK